MDGQTEVRKNGKEGNGTERREKVAGADFEVCSIEQTDGKLVGTHYLRQISGKKS